MAHNKWFRISRRDGAICRCSFANVQAAARMLTIGRSNADPLLVGRFETAGATYARLDRLTVHELRAALGGVR